MTFVDNLKIAHKALLALGIMTVCAIGTAFYAVTQLSAIDDRYSEVLERDVDAKLKVEEANISLLDYAGLVYRVIAETEQADMRATIARQDEIRTQFEERLVAASSRLPMIAPDINGIRTAFRRTDDAARAIATATLASDNTRALALKVTQYDPALAENRRLMRELEAWQRECGQGLGQW